MPRKGGHPVGAPAWVDTLQADVEAAMRFYGALFDWSFDPATGGANGSVGDYVTAHLAERQVAGIAQTPSTVPQAGWRTCVRVTDLDAALEAAEAAGGALLVEPMDAGAGTRVATLADATGVPFGLWHGDDPGGAELVNEPGTWQMSSLHSTDVERAHAFYGAVFGWVLEEVPGAPFSRWFLDDELVAVVTATDGVAVPPHWSVNFAVADVDAVAERATTLGGSVLMAPFDTPGFRNAVVADPQGAVFAVSGTAG